MVKAIFRHHNITFGLDFESEQCKSVLTGIKYCRQFICFLLVVFLILFYGKGGVQKPRGKRWYVTGQII